MKSLFLSKPYDAYAVPKALFYSASTGASATYSCLHKVNYLPDDKGLSTELAISAGVIAVTGLAVLNKPIIFGVTTAFATALITKVTSMLLYNGIKNFWSSSLDPSAQIASFESPGDTKFVGNHDGD